MCRINLSAIRSAVLVGLIALAHLMMPLAWYGGLSAGQASLVEICTPQGIRVLALDSDGVPAPVQPSSSHHEKHCPLCNGPFAPPQATPVAAGDIAPIHRPSARPAVTPAQTAFADRPPATGPPFFS
jgi:hypothetical protein